MFRVAVGFGDPDAPAIVEAHRDGLPHLGFPREERDLESLGDLHGGGGLLRRVGFRRFQLGRVGERRKADEKGEGGMEFHANAEGKDQEQVTGMGR